MYIDSKRGAANKRRASGSRFNKMKSGKVTKSVGVITHEEMHHAIHKVAGRKASEQLDELDSLYI